MDNKQEFELVRESRVIAELAKQSYFKRMCAAGISPDEEWAKLVYERALCEVQRGVYFKDE